MMPEVVPHDIALIRWIVPHVDARLVVGFVHDGMDIVVFDNVVVALQSDGVMRRIMEQIMRDTISDAVHQNGWRIGAVDARKVSNPVVFDIDIACRQRLAVTAANLHAAAAKTEEIVAVNFEIRGFCRYQAVSRQTRQRIGGEPYIMDILHDDARSLPTIKCQAVDDNMMRIFDLQEIVCENGQLQFGLIDRFVWIQIYLLRFSVQKPFTWLINGFQ